MAFDGMGNNKARIAEVLSVVCAGEGVTLAEMKSASRLKRLAIPRQYAMYLSRAMTGQSYPAIARVFGDRDHTTVLYGYEKVKALAQCSPPMAEKLAEYRSQIAALVVARVAASGQSSPWNPPAGLALLRPTSVTVTLGMAA